MLSRISPMRESLLLFTFSVVATGLMGLGSAEAAETLRFRLPKAKSIHVQDEATAKSYDKSLKTLGVASKLHGHDGHFDLSMQCPQWRQAEFGTHAEVEKWRKWLASLGFETTHQH